jgi:hypothetical protein
MKNHSMICVIIGIKFNSLIFKNLFILFFMNDQIDKLDFVKKLPEKKYPSYHQDYYKSYYKRKRWDVQFGRKTNEQRKQIFEDSKLKKKSGTYILKFD